MPSFNYRIRPIPPEERRDWKLCSSPKCQNEAVYVGKYDYITGRAGRVGTSNRPLCRVHAEKWAKKHGLELPEVEHA